MSDKNWQTILQVGCEGGCISLLGRKEKYDWSFTMTTDETSLRCFIHEEDLAGELETKSHIEYSWEGALRLLEQYPHWPSLYTRRWECSFCAWPEMAGSLLRTPEKY